MVCTEEEIVNQTQLRGKSDFRESEQTSHLVGHESLVEEKVIVARLERLSG